MNQPNSPRSGSEPSSKSLAQELFGVHFAPGGPLNDPDDLEGLDFGALAPAVTPEPPRLEEHAEEEFAGTPQVAESANESEPVVEQPLAEEPVRAFRPAPPVKERKPVPRLPVPRDDDGDDGFGVGLLDAFDDDDDDEESVQPGERSTALTSAQINVADDDDAIIEEVRPRAVRRAPEPVAEDREDEVGEFDAPKAAKPQAPHQKDDFWDALEGWDWETSQEGDRGPRASSDRPDRGRSSGDRPGRGGPDRDRGGRSDRGRPDREEAPRRESAPVEARREPAPAPARSEFKPAPARAAAEDRPPADRGREERGRADRPREDRPDRDRPRREEAPAARDRGPREDVAPAPKPAAAREELPRGRDESRGRGERSDRPVREERPAKPDSIFAGGEGGFADDLFDRLAQKESTRQPVSNRGRGDASRDVPRDRDADRDRLPPAKKTLDDLVVGEEDAGAGATDADQPRRPRRRRGGRGRGAAEDRPVDEVAPVESEAEFDDEPLAADDDGFGSGLAAPRRAAERRPAAERPASDRGGANRGSVDRGDRPARTERTEKDTASRPEQRPRRDRDESTDRPPARTERGARDEADRSAERPAPRDEGRRDEGRRDQPSREPVGREPAGRGRDEEVKAPRSDRGGRDDRPARDDRGSRDDRPARRESSDRGRDAVEAQPTRGPAPRADRGERDERPPRRESSERGHESEPTRPSRSDAPRSDAPRSDAPRSDRTDRDRDDRPPRRDRDDRPASRDEAPRSDRGPDRGPDRGQSERSSRDTARRPESSPPPATSHSRDDDDFEPDDRQSTRSQPQTLDAPTWEHAISLLISRPPRQDRGDSKSGPRGDDRGSSRGRGRRPGGK